MSKASRRFLEQHGAKWRVVVPVPRPLQKTVGATKLKRSLDTDSLATANLLKSRVIHELKNEMLRRSRGDTNDPLMVEAMALREELINATHEGDEQRQDDIAHIIHLRADEIAGDPVDESIDERTGGRVTVYEPEREAKAGTFAKLATGQSTPLRSFLTQWHGQSARKHRAMKNDERALGLLEAWCRTAKLDPSIENMTRKNAGLFIGHLCDKGGRSSATINKYLSSLSVYWKWLKKRGHVDQNVWDGQGLQKAYRVEDGEKERAFTDDEVTKLLSGDTKPYMHAMMRIAALTGARIDAIASLRVRDCRDALFRFKPQKKEKAARLVPIHSALKPLVEKLCKGKQEADALFPELPVPPVGSERERSTNAVKTFNRYRKAVGVDETVPGKRRGLVNFHSWRRWFVTKAEQAGQAPWVIASVVGHKRQGMTLGVYSAGPDMKQFRACVEAVKLPALKQRQAPSSKKQPRDSHRA